MSGRHVWRFVTLWLPLILWAGAIYYLSSRPAMPHVGPKLNDTEYLLDYAAHAAEFGVLCVLAWRVLRVYDVAGLSRRPAIAAWSVTAVYAALDEAHQAFVPGRMATFPDWLADIAGAALAVFAVSVWVRAMRRNHGDTEGTEGRGEGTQMNADAR